MRTSLRRSWPEGLLRNCPTLLGLLKAHRSYRLTSERREESVSLFSGFNRGGLSLHQVIFKIFTGNTRSLDQMHRGSFSPFIFLNDSFRFFGSCFAVETIVDLCNKLPPLPHLKDHIDRYERPSDSFEIYNLQYMSTSYKIYCCHKIINQDCLFSLWFSGG